MYKNQIYFLDDFFFLLQQTPTNLFGLQKGTKFYLWAIYLWGFENNIQLALSSLWVFVLHNEFIYKENVLFHLNFQAKFINE